MFGCTSSIVFAVRVHFTWSKWHDVASKRNKKRNSFVSQPAVHSFTRMCEFSVFSIPRQSAESTNLYGGQINCFSPQLGMTRLNSNCIWLETQLQNRCLSADKGIMTIHFVMRKIKFENTREQHTHAHTQMPFSIFFAIDSPKWHCWVNERMIEWMHSRFTFIWHTIDSVDLCANSDEQYLKWFGAFVFTPIVNILRRVQPHSPDRVVGSPLRPISLATKSTHMHAFARERNKK